MHVEDKVMYHFHKEGNFDDLWEVGKEIIIDDSFTSHYTQILDVFRTGVSGTSEGKVIPFDLVIDYYLNDENFQKLDAVAIKEILYDARQMIRNMNILNRERALEDYRKQYHEDLPSRLHSIWLADSTSFSFWKKELTTRTKMKIFKVLVTGELFTSSDVFIPNDEWTTQEMFQASKRYWEPVFNTKEEKEKREYLFQGKVKILEEIKKK